MQDQLELGRITIVAAEVAAYKGFNGKVFATPREALVSLAEGSLKVTWEREGAGALDFERLFLIVQLCPDLFESMVKLARFKNGDQRTIFDNDGFMRNGA